MAKIHNPTIREFHLPTRKNPKDKDDAFSAFLPAGATLAVPDWYLEALRKETNSAGRPTGWALRLTEDGTVKGPTGAAGAFEARIKAYREERDKALEQVKSQAARIEALEAELASSKREDEKKGSKKSD